ncbi:molybdopterin molybdenumtransferase MoeA [Arthrobacter sp. JZ12]|uniref:molybdopterin molybdotransferase MoeA n=1 Tax=Arthrobacter sp. JZ12 TaxID=2654190 RepID=UPI002B46AABD|nr:molybdopterin molybdotransferase MoeA [Arthrobacter sp. JZ12]WRH24060.1 molybdopterin molybdenumtransferase MoeA [Arthrobacter sp. JZ12]
MSESQRNVSWDDARKLAFEAATPKPPQTVNLADALGQTLAEPAVALQPIPHYASSAMDGWAVCGEPPWTLVTPVQEDESPWHRAHEHKKSGYAALEPGQATFILTGGVVPPNATGILRTEHGAVRDGVLTRNERARDDEPRQDEHIRPAGEEAAEGTETIPAGAVLNPAQIALAAVCGYDTLPVLRAPRVSLLLTGDEVIEAGLPEPGLVRDTFGPQLPGLVTMLGGHVDTVARARDDLDDVVAAISAEALDEMSLARASSDVLISTGGTGASDADHIRRALTVLEADLIIDGIAMRPGHPTLLARLPDGRFFVGLPGNPLAAMMALFTVGVPLLAGLRGATLPKPGCALAGEPFEPLPGRTRLVPYRNEQDRAMPTTHYRSGMLRGLAEADGVLIVPEQGCQPDEKVRALSLPWFS